MTLHYATFYLQRLWREMYIELGGGGGPIHECRLQKGEERNIDVQPIIIKTKTTVNQYEKEQE